MGRLRALLFDMFNTLVHNEPALWQRTFRDIVAEQGLPVDPEALWREWREREKAFRRSRADLGEPERVPPFRSYWDAWRECFQEAFQAFGVPGDPEGAVERAFQDLARREPFPEALEVLGHLRGKVRLALLSNADRGFLYPVLDRLGLWRTFDLVLCSEEVGAYKPLPLPFRRTLEGLGVAPEEAAQVGDNLGEDVLGARLVGMRAVWVNRDGAPRDPSLPAPDLEVRDLWGVARLVEEANP